MKKILKSKGFYAICGVLFLATIIGLLINQRISFAEFPKDILYDHSNEENQVLYLSDIPYSKGEVEWGNIALDKTQTNTPLTLMSNGTATVFEKGIWAHATSTIEFDISKYNNFDYFTTYYGLNTTANNVGNGVKFYVYTSVDGNDWTLRTEEDPPAIKSANNAVRLKIDIRGVNYLKLYAYNNGSNASDHAVWADAKLITEDYIENYMFPVEEYDTIIKNYYSAGPIKDELKLTLLQRNFIKNIGQKPLGAFLKADPKNKEMLEWFLNNEEALRLWTMGGKPLGTYEKALQVLSNLYHTYKDDLSNENLTANGTKYKDLYLKMMLSLSLSHSVNVGLWVGGNQLSDAVVRYDIYKQMHLNNKLGSNAMFESYTIDEMRYVMATNIDDEEILWLRDYSLKRYPDATQRFIPSKYVYYTFGYGYHRPQYYSQENYATWDAKYNLSAYNITYQAGKPKLWIVFEEGAVCGGISKTAANLYGVWGFPARVVGQPGHAAYIYLYNAGGGRYAWQLSYNAASTAWANTGGYALNGWGTRYATNGNGIQTGSYILLGQEAQNEYEKYEKASLILLQADIYKNDRQKLEQIYRDALAEERIHLDAWIGLTDLYLTDETKTDEDLYNLASEIAEVYAYHPLPMYDSTKRIAVKLKSSPAYYSKLMTLQDETLKRATKATSANTIFSKEVPVIANALLGIVDSRIATFSFDGENAGKIMLNKQLQSAQTSWSYSLDGGNTWKDTDDSFVQLTKEELESISPTNDIKVHITGLPKNPENIYTIDIIQGVFPAGSVSIDDFENRFNGTNNKMEWTTDLNGEWQAFSDATPLFKGDVVVYVRMIATGVYTTTTPVHYTFTTNASSLTNRFIPRDKISVKAAAPHGKYSFSNMLDGNINSAWYSKESSFGQGFQPANVILELDEPRYVSELDYIPFANAKTSLGGYPTGKARAITIQVSDDYQNWTTVATVNNLADNSSAKKITFDETRLAKYISIKFTAINNPSSLTSFVSVAVLNLYENPTVSEIPLAEVSYDIAKKTNKDVVAELVNENREITVTNNNGEKTHTFTENGEFTFEFVDNNGKKGSARALVDWIDKTPPKAEVIFSTQELTNENVVATITFDKDNVTILSNDIELAENPVDGSKTITFLENESIELKFQDELGNIGTKTINVDWIDIEPPTAEFEFSTTSLTDKPIVATLVPSEEVTITNNNGNNTYTFEENGEFTFEFVDRAGNEGTATANVFWIASLPEYEISYSTKELTNKDVIVTLTIEDGYKLMNNNGNNVYTFTENGTFSFKYVDNYGNVGYIPVTVDWIDKEVTGTIEYNITTLTDQNVIATLKTTKPVTITNNDGQDTYTFETNGEFTFEFVDALGNTGSATAKVDWIDKNAVIATITYDIETLTNKDVTATISFNKDGVIITNNDGKNTYTFTSNDKFSFEYIDANGNFGLAEANVTWIDKEAPTAKLEYERLNNKVIVKVIEPNEEITYKEGNGTYEYTKNGNYEIIIYDLVGNETKLIAVIEGLKNESQGGNGGGSTNPGDNDNKPDDNNPDKPSEGDKPDKPDIPDNSGPDNPNNDNNNPNEKPGNNDNQGNKPNVDPGNNNNPGTSTDNPNENKDYQKYAIKNIIVKIPQNYINEEMTLKSDTFSINNELKTFFGELSEYYDISLVNNKSESISFNGAAPLKISIKLNEDKQFIGVYKITDDNNIELLDYNKNGQNIEINDKELGKYVVSYKEKTNSSTKNPNNQKPTNKVNNYKLIFSIISCAVVILGIFTFAFKMKQPK